MGAGPTANNLLVAGVNGDAVPTLPSGWTAGPTGSGSSAGALFYKVASGSEGTSLVFGQASSSGMQAFVFEFSGAATSTPLDVSIGNGSSTTFTATQVSGTTGAVAASGELGVIFFGTENGADITGMTGSYTLMTDTTASPFSMHQKAAYNLNLGTGTQTVTATYASTVHFVVSELAVFKPLAAAAVMPNLTMAPITGF